MKMGSASMCCAVGLWAVLVLITVPHQSLAAIAGQSQSCVSSCGKIANISHPFRRKDDPPNCGDSKYELECVNEVAVLRLSQATEYHVQAINYNNYTIRLVDPNIEEANCSSIPRYFLYRFNFSDVGSYYYLDGDVDLYQATQLRGLYEDAPLFEHVMYMSCNSTVREYSSHHVDSSTSCLDLHTYVAAGNLHLKDLKPGCRVKLIAATSGLFQLQQQDPAGGPSWGYGEPTQNISYNDIHRALAYGFELSWWQATCRELHCGPGSCYFNGTTQKALCFSGSPCPSQYPDSLRRCGIRRLIRDFVTVFLQDPSLSCLHLGLENFA